MATQRLAFDAQAIRRETQTSSGVLRRLIDYLHTVTDADLNWFCERTVVEIAAPEASFDLLAPGAAEALLLDRVRDELGAGSFPNTGRHPVDVAAALIAAAGGARENKVDVSRAELIRRTQMRDDFGAVQRKNPINADIEVPRDQIASELLSAASSASRDGGRLLLTAPPGQGKTWVCQQLLNLMDTEGWLVAEHYCFLNDDDGERDQRVLVESIFGSLLGRLADSDPALVSAQRPRFVASEEALTAALQTAANAQSAGAVALVVDGLDHITRVRAKRPGSSDPSRLVADALAALDLPPGSVLIVLSQPGSHLDPLRYGSHTELDLPGLDSRELAQLSRRLHVIGDPDGPPDGRVLVDDANLATEFVTALIERSRGNALYATYLCREALRDDVTLGSPTDAVRSFPYFDGTLGNYYQRLVDTLEAGAWVAETLSVAEFALTAGELKELWPEQAHRVDRALDVLGPVLVERAPRQGQAVYHESFARYVRRELQKHPDALEALIAKIVAWLENAGLLRDARAYRHLLPLLVESGKHEHALQLLGDSFVVDSVAAAFPASSIKANLAAVVRSAATLGDWATAVRYVEMSRAADTFQFERYATTLVDFADVFIALVGADTVAERLLNDNQLAMPARNGILMCEAVDQAGGVAPWADYLPGLNDQEARDNTDYGDDSDYSVARARLRGELRLAAVNGVSVVETATRSEPAQDTDDAADRAAIVDWTALADAVTADQLKPDDLVEVLCDVLGAPAVLEYLPHATLMGETKLAIAELIYRRPPLPQLGGYRRWAREAVDQGLPHGLAHRVLALGVGVDRTAAASAAEQRPDLFNLTRTIQRPRTEWARGHVEAWLDLCAIAAHRDVGALNATEALVNGDGWWSCWLKFAIDLVRAEAASETRSALALNAIKLLTGDLRRYVGNPRAVDLYFVHATIADTIRRALALLEEADWTAALTILMRVSDELSITLKGELGGPMPADLTVSIAADIAPEPILPRILQMLEVQVRDRSDGRYYADIASFHLLAARIHLRIADMKAAHEHWRDAATLLTGYGWRKDTTIYELLNPLEHLIAANRELGRTRVAAIQGLCERVPLHTDGSETRGAWSEWWRALSLADPTALATIAARRLLSACNNPDKLRFDALEEFWTAAAEPADPVVAAALRITLDSPTFPTDAEQLQRLVTTADTADPATQRLLVAWLARLDERHTRHSYTDGGTQLAQDDAEVDKINQVAAAAGLPQSIAVRDSSRDALRTTPTGSRSQTRVPSPARQLFADGAAGLGRAIREWKRVYPVDSLSPELYDAFASAIGYRLVELAQNGAATEAEAALYAVCELNDYGDHARMLHTLAEGLQRHELTRLSAIAYALTWTRARGQGGYLAFGGETALHSLLLADRIDRGAVVEVVTRDLELHLAGANGTYGLTQGLIIAVNSGALTSGDASSNAFAVWDSARGAIERRAPVTAAEDEPTDRYEPTPPGTGSARDLNRALTVATFAGIAHATRERKRRSLLAIGCLFQARPRLAADAARVLLALPADPATLCWVMSMLAAQPPATVDACREELRSFCDSDFLTVRALARRLLGTRAPALRSASSPHPALLGPSGLLLHDGTPAPLPASHRSARVATHAFAQKRVLAAEPELPGFVRAVVSTVHEQMTTSTFRNLRDKQHRAYADNSRRTVPDIYLADEEAVEEAIQRVAAGGRAARLATGNPVANPVAWEDMLADRLVPELDQPLRLERTRIPRPPFPIIPAPDHDLWKSSAAISALANAEADDQVAVLALGDTDLGEAMSGGQFHGWQWLATYEKRQFDRPNSSSRRATVTAQRFRAFELQDPRNGSGLDSPPVADGDLANWGTHVAGVANINENQPLVGIDFDVADGTDVPHGLGVPDGILTPTRALQRVLDLQPADGFTLQDARGPGMALTTWRTDYDISEYHAPTPDTAGCGILIRPDLYNQLAYLAGPRLAAREVFVVDIDLLATPPDAAT